MLNREVVEKLDKVIDQQQIQMHLFAQTIERLEDTLGQLASRAEQQRQMQLSSFDELMKMMRKIEGGQDPVTFRIELMRILERIAANTYRA